MAWSREEVEFLKNNYLSKTYVEIGKSLSKNPTTVGAMAKRIGLNKNSKWTDEETETLIKAHKDGHEYKYIASLLDKSLDKVKRKVVKLVKEGVLTSRRSSTKAISNSPNSRTIISLSHSRYRFLYVVNFGEFYKVGVTTRPLYKRFRASSYPKYSVVLLTEIFKYENSLEKLLINEFTRFTPVHPAFFRESGGGSGGHTECFIANNQHEVFLAVASLLAPH